MRNFMRLVIIVCFAQANYSYPFPNPINDLRLSFFKNLSSITQAVPDLQFVEVENLQILDQKDSSNYDYQRTSCQIVQIVHLLHHIGCRSKAIASFACSGSCLSYVQISMSKLWQNERSCSCCQETSLQEAIFTLDCPLLDPPYRKVKTYAPKDCMCRGCTNLEDEKSKTQEM